MTKEITGCVTDVPGVKVGHAVSHKGRTGCTVVLFEDGAVAGVDIGGSAPGTRETELLNPTNMILRIHAIMLAGGSTFGLQAASGVQKYLQERDIGFRASTGVVVPIVPSAVIFDLDVGKPRIYPDRVMGQKACEAAVETPSKQGAIGAGFGATCGKILGSDFCMRGGLGTASYTLKNGVVVGALTVCNAWGDVVDPESNQIVAGARHPLKPDEFLNTDQHIEEQMPPKPRFFGMDTTLCLVATDAKFSQEEITKIAMMAQDGIARSIRPSHTQFDGDVVFCASTSHSNVHVDVNIIGHMAARLVTQAIVRGVLAANRRAQHHHKGEPNDRFRVV